MKKLLLAAALFVAASASAQTYPSFNPTYVPSAVLAPITLPIGATNNYFTVSGLGVVSVRVTGTCTSLAATLTATNDGVTYTAINLYPIATGTSAPTAVASVSAAGFWKANVQGFTKINFNVSALTVANCSVSMVGSPDSFNGTTF